MRSQKSEVRSQKFWLIAILLLVLALRVPSWWEPYWYGDEGITMAVGQAWRHGAVLYQDVQDNKPPLLYWMAGIVGSLAVFKVFLTGWMMGTVYIFWRLANYLYGIKVTPSNSPSERGRMTPVLISTLVFAVLTSIPLWEGNAVNGEIFFVGPVIAGIYLLVNCKFQITNNKQNYSKLKVTPPSPPLARGGMRGAALLAGALFGAGVLFKVPAIIDLIAAVIIMLLLNQQKSKLWSLRRIYRKFLPVVYLGLGFAVPFLMVGGLFAWQGAIGDLVQSVLLNNFLYSNKWVPVDAWGSKMAWGGELWQRGLVVLSFTWLVFLLHKKLKFPVVFVSIWLIWSMLGATLSGRPYPHYLLQAVPAISLAIGWLAENIKYQISNIKDNYSYGIKVTPSISPLAGGEYRSMVIPPNLPLVKGGNTLVVVLGLVLTVWMWARIGYWRYPVYGYYENFVQYAAGNKPRIDYRNWFDNKVERTYAVSDWINTNLEDGDEIYIWGNDPQIYVLTDKPAFVKYLASYHVRDFGVEDFTLGQLEANLPEAIVVMEEVGRWEELDILLRDKYMLVDVIEESRIFVRI